MASGELVDVAVQVLFGQKMEGAVDASPQEAPEALQPVRVDGASDTFTDAVIDGLVLEGSAQVRGGVVVLDV